MPPHQPVRVLGERRRRIVHDVVGGRQHMFQGELLSVRDTERRPGDRNGQCTPEPGYDPRPEPLLPTPQQRTQQGRRSLGRPPRDRPYIGATTRGHEGQLAGVHEGFGPEQILYGPPGGLRRAHPGTRVGPAGRETGPALEGRPRVVRPGLDVLPDVVRHAVRQHVGRRRIRPVRQPSGEWSRGRIPGSLRVSVRRAWLAR